MEDTITIKRLENEIIEKLENLQKAQVNIKELICKAIMDYKIEDDGLKPTA